MKTNTLTLVLLALLTYLAPTLALEAVVPAPDGCYPNYTTAEGCNALQNLVGGAGNTGLGWYTLFSDVAGSFNTGVGGGALALNTADSNTAVGAAALLLNTTGTLNVAVGTDAMVYNDTGNFNTANGAFALFSNTGGGDNTANGFQALFSNTNGDRNTATGSQALVNNIGANNNTAHGFQALHNTNASNNTGIGFDALQANTTGNSNTAVGANALRNATGSGNIALGESAGASVLAGNNNIEIGNGGGSADDNTIRIGLEGTQTQTFIAGILGNGPFACGVTIDAVTGQLGVGACVSSRRFKKDIDSMDKTSEAIFALKPVTFHYKNDKTNMPQFGLIAEEVAKVNPALIAVDKEGKPYSVRYQQINAMLLNEFLKEHREVQKLKKQVVALTAGLQKVNAQLEASKPAPRVVENNR